MLKSTKVLIFIGGFIILIIIFIIGYLMFKPVSHPFSGRNAFGVLMGIHTCQVSYKSSAQEDQNKNGIGEYTNSINTLVNYQDKIGVYFFSNKGFPHPDKQEGYYFKIYTSLDTLDREKHFEAHAWPINYKERTRKTLVIDETQKVRAKDMGGEDVPMGDSKDWPEFDINDTNM
jgi:hypothetical protein